MTFDEFSHQWALDGKPEATQRIVRAAWEAAQLGQRCEMNWTSVYDEMPPCEKLGINTKKKFTVVMVYHAGGHDIAMYYENDGFKFTNTSRITEEGRALHELKAETVTHWMPLPEPPRG